MSRRFGLLKQERDARIGIRYRANGEKEYLLDYSPYGEQWTSDRSAAMVFRGTLSPRPGIWTEPLDESKVYVRPPHRMWVSKRRLKTSLAAIW